MLANPLEDQPRCRRGLLVFLIQPKRTVPAFAIEDMDGFPTLGLQYLSRVAFTIIVALDKGTLLLRHGCSSYGVFPEAPKNQNCMLFF